MGEAKYLSSLGEVVGVWSGESGLVGVEGSKFDGGESA